MALLAFIDRVERSPSLEQVFASRIFHHMVSFGRDKESSEIGQQVDNRNSMLFALLDRQMLDVIEVLQAKDG